MDRRLAQPRQPRQHRKDEAAALDRVQREHDAGRGKYPRPCKVRQREDRVEGGELRHAPVERVRRVAEDDRVAEGLDHIAHPKTDRAEEEREKPRPAVRDEVGDECPRRGRQGEGRRHPGQMEDDDQRQVQQRGDVAEAEPEHEQVGGGARLGRVPVVPRPRAFPALPHLGQVGVRVVSQVEEAHEDLAVRLHHIGVQVGQRCDDGNGEAREQRNLPAGRRKRRRAVSHPLYFPVHRRSRSRRTVQRARRTSPCETFEAPATRSSNRIGVSTTRYPSRRARYTISI